MKWYSWLVMIILCMLAGVGAYTLARGSLYSFVGHHGGLADRPEAGMLPLAQWLEVNTTQENKLTELDPKFRQDASTLAQAVQQERLELLDLLNSPKATDDQIQFQVENVLSAEADLQRRVTHYVIKARSVLTPAQQQRLLGLYGQRMGCNYRGGMHDPDVNNTVSREIGRHGMNGGNHGNGGGNGHHGGHD